jgi:hypothetical protein
MNIPNNISWLRVCVGDKNQTDATITDPVGIPQVINIMNNLLKSPSTCDTLLTIV